MRLVVTEGLLSKRAIDNRSETVGLAVKNVNSVGFYNLCAGISMGHCRFLPFTGW